MVGVVVGVVGLGVGVVVVVLLLVLKLFLVVLLLVVVPYDAVCGLCDVVHAGVGVVWCC